MHYHTDAGTGAAVVDIPDTGEQGSGSMSLEFLVAPLPADPVTVVGDATIELAGRRLVGETYELTGRAEFELGP